MTRGRDIGRVLDEFYAEGPSEMPDRVFLGVFDRIERVPQRRLAFLTRFATMNPNLRLAAAAAIVVAVVGVGAFALSQQANVGPPTTASPSPSTGPIPTAGPSLEAMPAALRYKWVGEPRSVPQIVPAIACSRLWLGTGQLQYNGCRPQDPFLTSTVGLASPSSLVFTLNAAESGCAIGDVGTYSFVLSPNGKGLLLTLVADACVARAGAISGDWNRSDCPEASSPCLGDLDAGTHLSANFNPFVPASAWVANFGALSYTVPAGWANVEDCDFCYLLAKQGAPENTGIYIWSEVASHVQADQCTEGPEPGAGRTADAIVTWLTTLPGLVTTTPEPITIGGLTGMIVDLTVSPTWTATCPYAYSPGLPLVSTFSGPEATGGIDWNIQGEGRTRIIALDLGDGRALVINIEAQNKADYDALLPGAMEVVNTFMFNR